MAQLTFYAPIFIDESMTYPDKRGLQKPTGNLRGLIMTRTFTLRGKNIKASRGMVPFSWREDEPESKAAALAKAIEGMQEMAELDDNPSINWIPTIVKEKLL